MKIATIGAGNIGGTLGDTWTKAGHQVVYGLRDPSKREDAKPIDQALLGAEVVLLLRFSSSRCASCRLSW
jgi:predicted dinucleotide-binding enzyme